MKQLYNESVTMMIEQALVLLDEPEANPDVSPTVLAMSLMEHLDDPRSITTRPMLGSLLINLFWSLKGKALGFIRDSKELLVELVKALTAPCEQEVCHG